MKKVKICIVGLNRGSILARKAMYCPSIDLVGICDLDIAKAEKLQKELHIPRVWESYQEALASDIDAVILATPIPDHADHIVAGLAAGKHVLCEVICGRTMDECRRIGKAIQESGKKFMMEENYCYIRPLTIVHEMIRAGLLGEMYYGEADYIMDFQLRRNFPEGIEGWRKEVYFGHRGHPYITHTLGPLCYLLDDNISAVSCLGAGKFRDLTADNTCVLMLKTQRDKMIRLRNTFITARPDLYTYYSVQGTKGCYQGAQGPTDFHKIHLRDVCRPNEWLNLYDYMQYLPKAWDILPKDMFDNITDDGCVLYDSGTSLLLEDFARCIIDDTEPTVNGLRALNWTAAGIMSEASIHQNGKLMPVPDFKEYFA